MFLRQKFISVILAVFVLFVAGQIMIHYLIILPSLKSIEETGAVSGYRRTIDAIEREIEHLDEICHDWASYDETFRFMADHNSSYITANLSTETFTSLKLVYIAFVDPAGKIVWARGFDPQKKADVSIDEFLPGRFPADILLPVYHGRKGMGYEEKRNGFFLSSIGPLLICSRPILTSSGEGAARGSVLMARRVDSFFMRKISSLTNVRFNFYPVQDKNMDSGRTWIIQQLGEGKPYVLMRKRDTIIHYSLIHDISRRSQLLLETTMPRVISLEHYRSMTYALIYTIAIVLVLFAVFFIIFETHLFHPLSYITWRISDITEFGDLSQRMGIDRKDEIGVLARAFDGLIERLYHAGSKLMEEMERIKVEMEIRKKVEEMLTEANSKLDELASTDGLTGLLNRRKFDEELRRLWRHSMRTTTPLTIIIFDVDYFKKYNDTYGHQAGDSCLQGISRNIAETFQRPLDIVARYGGEEFIAALPETDVDTALALAKRLLESVSNLNIRHETSDAAPNVTISAGIATAIPSEDGNVEDMIRSADRALYRAKENGRNRIEAGV